MDYAFSFVQRNGGICSEEDYQYIARSTTHAKRGAAPSTAASLDTPMSDPRARNLSWLLSTCNPFPLPSRPTRAASSSTATESWSHPAAESNSTTVSSLSDMDVKARKITGR